MVFNEILIPQDSLTETNVTRKRSVIENSWLYSKIILFKNFTFCLYTFYILENTENNNDTTWHTRMMHQQRQNKNKNNSYKNTKWDNKSNLCRIFFLLFSNFLFFCFFCFYIFYYLLQFLTKQNKLINNKQINECILNRKNKIKYSK